MPLAKPTRWCRATLTTTPRIILGAEPGSYAYRKVTILILDSPDVELALDIDPKKTAGRDAYMPRPPTGKTICLCIGPGQHIVGRSIEEIHEASIIVEYWKD